MYAFSQRIKLLWRGFTRTSRGVYRECYKNVYKMCSNKNSKYNYKSLFIKNTYELTFGPSSPANPLGPLGPLGPLYP